MKKVGIVTIISRNVGNRLQNYAMQEVLRKLGVDCVTIPLVSGQGAQPSTKLAIKKILSLFWKRYGHIEWERFDQKIIWNYNSITDMRIDEIDSFDYFVAGSDQIWNPLFTFNSDREFLTFAKENQRVAYAASIGISMLPENQIERFKKNLSGMKYISVREDDASRLIENLTGRKVPVVLDPTMLLSKDEWEDCSNASVIKPKDTYVFKYILGIRNDEYDKYICDYAKGIGAKVVDFISENDSHADHWGPAEFLYLIDHADAVFTDSFHATVFSILFHKKFRVFERPIQEGYGMMGSRLDTLLTKFDLLHNRVREVEDLAQHIITIDYEVIEGTLKKERMVSIEYLRLFL